MIRNSRLTHSESGETLRIYKQNWFQAAINFAQKIFEISSSGCQMSRTSALKTITLQQRTDYLSYLRVTLIGGGLDESPQAYKPIQKIIDAQFDLVDIIGTF